MWINNINSFFFPRRKRLAMEGGHTIVKIKGKELARLEKNFKGTYNGTYNGLVRVTPGNWLYPGAFKYYKNKIYNFKVSDNTQHQRNSNYPIMTILH